MLRTVERPKGQRVSGLLLCLLLSSLGCTEPRGYAITGTWEGSSAQGTLRLEFAQNGNNVTGSGSLRNTDATTITWPVLSGILQDSSLSVVCPGTQNCGGYPAQISATYRLDESNAGQFTVHMTGPTFVALMTRR